MRCGQESRIGRHGSAELSAGPESGVSVMGVLAALVRCAVVYRLCLVLSRAPRVL